MSVLERIREIGALRAMGLTRGNISTVVGVESALLGFWGSALGMALLAILVNGLRWLEPQWIPPQLSRSIPLDMYLSAEQLIISALLFIIFALLVGVLMAVRAVKKNIVQALTYT
jgi:putative ABC transport system permease protein